MQPLLPLDLCGLELSIVPSHLGAGHHALLTSLDLSKNHLRDTGGALATLTGLTTLNLAGNRLSACPGELPLLTALVELNLSQNCLELAAGFGSLRELRILQMQRNRLPGLAAKSGLGELTGLEELDLSCNPLRVFPHALLGCRGLSKLRIDQAVLPQSLLDRLAEVPEAGRAGVILGHDWMGGDRLTSHELFEIPEQAAGSSAEEEAGGLQHEAAAVVAAAHAASTSDVALAVLAAVVGDASIAGTDLEGVSLQQGSEYLRRGLGRLCEEGRETDIVGAVPQGEEGGVRGQLQTAQASLAQLEAVCGAARRGSDAMVQAAMRALSRFEADGEVLLPGGYGHGSPGYAGHSMLYRLRREADGSSVSLTLYNTGPPGLEFHPWAIAGSKRAVHPAVSYGGLAHARLIDLTSNPGKATPTLALRDLISALCEIYCAPSEEGMAQDIYRILDASLRALGGEPHAKAVGLVTASRLETSGWKVLLTGYLRSLVPHEAYKRLRVGLSAMAMADLIALASSELPAGVTGGGLDREEAAPVRLLLRRGAERLSRGALKAMAGEYVSAVEAEALLGLAEQGAGMAVGARERFRQGWTSRQRLPVQALEWKATGGGCEETASGSGSEEFAPTRVDFPPCFSDRKAEAPALLCEWVDRCEGLLSGGAGGDGAFGRCLGLALEITASLPVPGIELPLPEQPEPERNGGGKGATSNEGGASTQVVCQPGFYEGWGATEASALARLNGCLVSCLHGSRVEEGPAEVSLAAYQNAVIVYHICRLRRRKKESCRLDMVNLDTSALQELLKAPAALSMADPDLHTRACALWRYVTTHVQRPARPVWDDAEPSPPLLGSPEVRWAYLEQEKLQRESYAREAGTASDSAGGGTKSPPRRPEPAILFTGVSVSKGEFAWVQATPIITPFAAVLTSAVVCVDPAHLLICFCGRRAFLSIRGSGR